MSTFFPTESINLDKGTGASENRTEFRPNTRKARDKKKYTAVIRFIPNPFDTANKSVINKARVYLKNPISNKGMYIDCPSSVGLPDPLSDHFFELSRSENQFKKEAAKHFSRKLSYTSIVQVLKCDDEPQLVNKLLTWTYGSKVYQKLEKEMKPEFGEPRNPFDLINGRVFVVSVVEVSGFQNFDGCYFTDIAPGQNAARIELPQKDAQGNPVFTPITDQMATDQKSIDYIIKYFQDNCPDTKPYEYQPWTSEIEQFVEQSFQAYNNPGQLNQMAAAYAQQVAASAPQAAPMQIPGMPQANTGIPTTLPGMTPVQQPMAQTVTQPNTQPVINMNVPQQAVQMPTSNPTVQLGMNSLGDLTQPAAQPAAQPAGNPLADLGLGDEINSLIHGGNKGSEDAQPAVDLQNAASFDDIMSQMF